MSALMQRGLRPVALGDQIAHRLRVEIITRVIPDGTHLAEDALAGQFDVSRGPVRDALRLLESEGLVQSRRKRLYVRSVAMEDLEELFLLRGALESLAVHFAIGNATEQDWRDLDAFVDGMRDAAAREDYEAFATMDLAFHNHIYRIAGKLRLEDAWRPFQRIFEVLFELSNTPDMLDAILDHQTLLDILRSGEEDKAVEYLQSHLQKGRNRVRDFLVALEESKAANPD